MAILTFIKTNIFWIIFGILSMIFLFVLIKIIAPIRRQIKLKQKRPRLKFEEPRLEEEIRFGKEEPRLIENRIPEIKKQIYPDIFAIENPSKIPKKEIIRIPKKIVYYSEKEEGDRKKLQQEIKELKREIIEKEKENNRKVIVQNERKTAKIVKKRNVKNSKKKVAKRK
jgi:hypothetical protein